MKDKGITHGIKTEVLNAQLEPKKKILICEATLPQHGMNAEIRYIELPKYQPKINDDGSTDHYDLDFIKEVKKKVHVLDHLIIPGYVDYSTGNIEFNGNVTVERIHSILEK